MNSVLRPAASIGLVVLGLGGGVRAAVPIDTQAVIEEYQADLFGINGFYDLNWSLNRINRLERLQHDWQARLGAVDFDALDQHGRVDYLLLRTKLTAELDDQALDRRRLTELAELLPFREPIQALEEARWRLEPIDSEKAASLLAQLPDQVKQLRERLDQGKKPPPADKKDAGTKPAEKPGPTAGKKDPKSDVKKEAPPALKPSPSLALRAASAVGSLRHSFRTWFTFYDGFTPEFSWWVRKPHEAADKAIEEYAKYLREEIAGQHGKDEDALVGDPDRRGGTQAKSGRRDDCLLAPGGRGHWPARAGLVRSRDAQGLREWAVRTTGKSALAKVKASFVPPGNQDDYVAQQAREAIHFVKQHDLVTVPPLCEETWRLTMTSPESQKTMPYAAYGGQEMTVAYASESMKHDDKLMAMRGNNRHFTRIVTAHELIPGHHLERFTPIASVPTGGSSVRLSSSRAGASTGRCGSGTSAMPEAPRTASACSSGE